MSGGLAPSKSTLYVSNFPFSLTNNDLHKLFEKYGKVVKVTIVKDRVTRKSKGVAFVLFLQKESAFQAVRALNNTQLFGRNIKCTIAKDNGRATEFIRKKNYPDKSKCYECGEEGHLSYKCPKNILGEREPPAKKTKKEKKQDREERDKQFYDISDEDSDNEGGEDPKADSLAAAIQYQHQKQSGEEPSFGLGTSSLLTYEDFDEPKRKRYKKDAYFSDEEEIDDET